MNAGINSHLAWTVAQRLDAVLKLKPHASVLLIGTNDCMGSFDKVRSTHNLNDLSRLLTRSTVNDTSQMALRRNYQHENSTGRTCGIS